jgi:hypothetical protein
VLEVIKLKTASALYVRLRRATHSPGSLALVLRLERPG